MCLITYAPKGVQTLDWATLDYSGRQNADGYGVAWYSDRKEEWIVSRSLRPKTMRKVINRIPDGAPLVIHQRMTTHGLTSLENAHPFILPHGGLLFHNGIIRGTRADNKIATDKKDDKGKCIYVDNPMSDTAAFVADELAPFIESVGHLHWVKNEKGILALENRIGYGSVLAITKSGDPVPALVNEWGGHWDEGVFYSNRYSRPSQWESKHGYGSGYGADDSRAWARYYGKGSYSGYEWEDYCDPNAPKTGTGMAISDGDERYAVDNLDDEAWEDHLADQDSIEQIAADYEANRERLTVEEQDEWDEWLRSEGYTPTKLTR